MALFGGRGANSSYGKEGVNTGGNEKPLPFYDRTELYRGMSRQEYERRIRNRKVEWIGLYNENDEIVVAGTSNNKGAVAIPTTHPDYKKATRMTHNHPADMKNRYVGGSFSEADVLVATSRGMNSVRAVAPENKDYQFARVRNTKTGTSRLYKNAIKVNNTNAYGKAGSKAVSKIKAKFTRQGKTMSQKVYDQVYFGVGKQIWQQASKGTGWEYSEKHINPNSLKPKR